MKRLLRYFVQGLILTVPAVVTGYVCYGVFVRIDSWLHLPIPGAGFVATISAITLIGFLGPPVLVALSADGALRGFGFITQESLAMLGLHDSVAVYFPQSYAFAGNTIIVPASRVTRIDAVSSDVMAFVVSGGVTEVPRISDS